MFVEPMTDDNCTNSESGISVVSYMFADPMAFERPGISAESLIAIVASELREDQNLDF